MRIDSSTAQNVAGMMSDRDGDDSCAMFLSISVHLITPPVSAVVLLVGAITVVCIVCKRLSHSRLWEFAKRP